MSTGRSQNPEFSPQASRRGDRSQNENIRDRSICRHRKLISSLVLFLCLLGTVYAWHASSNYLKKAAKERFAIRANEITTQMVKRIQANSTILRGGVALFAAHGEVSREQWRIYVDTLRAKETHPGIQGFGFSKVIPPAELKAHIAKIRAEGFPHYTVRPEGKREIYTSIIYLEPFDERNQRAFGYDMLSEPVRRTAMEEARDADMTTLSGKVKLVQETEKDVQSGFLLYVPVYKNGMPTATVAERRAALFGYVYSPLRIKDLIQGTFGGALRDIDLEIYDGTDVSEQSLMFDDDESHYALSGRQIRLFTDKRVVELYGHQWTLSFSSLPSFETRYERQVPLGILLSGLAISLLLFLFIRSLENTREQALIMVRNITASRDELGREIAARTEAEVKLRTLMEALEQTNKELEQRLNEIKTLRGILPICSSCKKIRNDKGYWEQMELYIRDHSEAEFSHGMCDDCAKMAMEDLEEFIRKNPNSKGKEIG